ncbi:TIM barrel protein [Brenneria goodwinii]|uniref:sugar phosphate isomerase/epimerase family protein n=1 Tax=Brenneria goodwinii TaxID=1109412 RepID=UPI00065E7B60|nr:TIM barrel protein [Brenneria goodwinii]
MGIRISSAPCCWGVDDVTNPHLPPWERVLSEAHQAGYKGIELGPYGYIPLELERVSAELEKNDLIIVAGTIFDDMVSESNYQNLLRQTGEICSLITKLPQTPKDEGQHFAAPYLTVMDWGHDERDYAAGHPDRAPKLPEDVWKRTVEHFYTIAKKAWEEYGVRAVIHPHAGGYVEFADEIDRIADEIPPEVAGFCLDTGHLTYSGMDPVEWLRKYASRLDYVHFKDIDSKVYSEVMKQKIRFFEACAKGVMCPIGQGIVDYQAVLKLLKEIDYNGFITVEQEKDPRNADASLAEVKKSLDYLLSVGY